MTDSMDTKTRLDAVNRLLSDVFGQHVRISALLADYLNAEQIELIKEKRLADFLALFLFGVRCRFAALSDGMRMYAALAARYGLEDDAVLYALSAPDHGEGVSQDYARRLQEKALRRLQNARDMLKLTARLAARETLGLEALPAQPERHATVLDMVAPLSTEGGVANTNQGAPWTPELDQRLMRRFGEGATQNALAAEMGRTIGGIRARLKKLGLIEG